MTLEQARETVRDSQAPFAQQVEAAGAISESPQAELSDLIRCLRLRGLPAEIAALALYQRTGRPRPQRPSDVVVDATDWSRYLADQLELASK
jgi:hypothetical protein